MEFKDCYKKDAGNFLDYSSQVVTCPWTLERVYIVSYAQSTPKYEKTTECFH